MPGPVRHPQSFTQSVLERVWPDFRAGFWEHWRVIIEAIAALGIGSVVLLLFGRRESIQELFIETLVTLPACVALFTGIHAGLSVLRAVRSIYYEQQDALSAATAEHIKAQSLREKFARVQQQLISYADTAPIGGNSVTGEMVAWINGARTLLDGMLIGHTFHRDTSRITEWSNANEEVYQAVAQLRAIAASLKPEQLR